MAFIVKNKSKKVGEVKADGKWISVPPNSSISLQVSPSLLTPNLTSFAINETGKLEKSSTEKSSAGKSSHKKNSESVGLTISSSLSESSDSVTIG